MLVGVAAAGGVPSRQAIETMDHAVSGCGLIIPELETLKYYERTPTGTPSGGSSRIEVQGGLFQEDLRKTDQPPDTVGRRRRMNSKTAACEDWLKRVLADGRPRRSLELQRRARQHGLLRLSESITRNSPFQDARKRLGIVITRRGFGPGACYEWSLPTGDHRGQPLP